jgi:hypothetical protein
MFWILVPSGTLATPDTPDASSTVKARKVPAATPGFSS